jgi:hypothetical protein
MAKLEKQRAVDLLNRILEAERTPRSSGGSSIGA